MGGALYALAAGSVRMYAIKLMAGKEARSFLLAHLAKSHYTKPLSSLDDVKDFVERCYPSLETEMVNVGGEAGNGSERWVVVLSSKYVTLLRSSLGPIRPARMVFHEDGRYTTFMHYHVWELHALPPPSPSRVRYALLLEFKKEGGLSLRGQDAFPNLGLKGLDGS